jgi:asparagine synthase (glutamine-hydrolysing)
MCGIYGSVSLAGTALCDPAAVLGMEQALWHRGPDTGGHLEHPDAILGSRRLSIMDLSDVATQPFTSPDGQVSIVCNGEIYNAPELRQRYAAGGYPFRTDHNDVEPILPLYLEHGIGAVARLDGMFGLAIWDQRTRQLILARDRAGEKPLFYSEHQGELAFASEIQALLGARDAIPDISTAALSDYLTLGYCTAPRTMFEGIRKLEAGHLLVADRNGLRVERYWNPMDFATRESVADSAEILDVFGQSVQRQMVADVPVGIFTSGGLDSSMIAAEAVRHRPPESVRTFAVSFASASYDESQWATKVAKLLGTTHRTVHADEPALHRALDHVSAKMAEPLGDPAILPSYLLAEAASEEVKVVLSGEGADELFGGYPTYLGHRWAERFRRLPAPVRNALRGAVHRLPVTNRKVSLSFLARRFVDEAERDTLDRHIAWFGALGPWADQVGVTYEAPPLADSWAALDQARHPVKQAMIFDMLTYLAENLLTKVDRATMLASLEVRAPFLDRMMLELGLRQPLRTSVSNFSTKVALKRAALQRLPRDVVYRRKRGLSVPVSGWLNGELREEVDAMFEPERLRRQGLLKPGLPNRLLTEHREGRADHGRKLWPLFVLQRWHGLWYGDR